MIFVGDIAIPYPNAIKLKNFPERLRKAKWFGNLEGALIDNSYTTESKQSVVFNDRKAILSLLGELSFEGFALANNHIFDTGTLEETTSFLKNNNIEFGGAGVCVEDANTPILLTDVSHQIKILNFGWEVIQCEITNNDNPGVNRLEKDHVLSTFYKEFEKSPEIPIILFFHWNYELEAYPHPLERELARELIRNGAAAVIGCHPHRAGGIELYEGAPIVYSLGNFMFFQNYYYNGKAGYPDFCKLELAFEWNNVESQFYCHFFEYNKNENTLTYIKTESVKSGGEEILRLTPFANLTDEDYKVWYSKNRYHKFKGLPIFYYEDSKLLYKLKKFAIKCRDLVIKVVVKFKS